MVRLPFGETTTRSSGSNIFLFFNSFSRPKVASSTTDCPTGNPCSLKTWFARAPAINISSAVFRNLVMSGSFVSNFAPPIINRNGCLGSNTFDSCSTSFCNWYPAYDGRYFGIPTSDAWARCETENASFIYTSPRLASDFANTLSFVFSPSNLRIFSTTSTVPGVSVSITRATPSMSFTLVKTVCTLLPRYFATGSSVALPSSPKCARIITIAFFLSR